MIKKPKMHVAMFDGDEQEAIREWANYCTERGHTQQVAYSTHHDGLTQVCFDCRAIRTTILDAMPLSDPMTKPYDQ